MQEQNTSRLEVKEESRIRSGTYTARQDPLVRAFYADPDFVRATDEGIMAAKAGEIGILLEDLRRQVSEQSSTE